MSLTKKLLLGLIAGTALGVILGERVAPAKVIALANNVVPAVVLFSVFIGIALIGVERRQVVLDLLAVVGSALSRITRFVVGLTPYGIFVVSAVCSRHPELRTSGAHSDLPYSLCCRTRREHATDTPASAGQGTQRSGIRRGAAAGSRCFGKRSSFGSLELSNLLESKRMDVILMSAERGSILTLLAPEYAIVVPEPGIIIVPVAYPIARRDQRWRVFMDTWIELQQRNGTIEELYGHWVLGKNAERQRPRWSVIHNVLHWVD